MNTNFTEEEIKLLSDNKYDMVIGDFACRISKPDIWKRNNKWFCVGVEGEDVDVDGDFGWARQWISKDTLQEAITFALSNPVYTPKGY